MANLLDHIPRITFGSSVLTRALAVFFVVLLSASAPAGLFCQEREETTVETMEVGPHDDECYRSSIR